ncbi:MAG: hypothetical protein IPL39_21475 [Opitutaceae bacterium]|nr:hypothetical protein [Opitutaceae bacterium]
MTNITGATVSDALGTGTIANDDVAPSTRPRLSATDLLNPAICGPSADPDGVGFNNLMRYASAGAVSAPTQVPGDATNHPSPAADGDLVYAYGQRSVTWPESRLHAEARNVHSRGPAGAKRYFLRLDIVTK